VLVKSELDLFQDACDQMKIGFASLPKFEQKLDQSEELANVLQQLAIRMQDNFPYFHPLFAGQMQKPPHVVARLAYNLALLLNPNNHSLDGGRATSAMEKETVAEIAKMFGWSTHLGHLCGGGSVANLEALWVASKIHPGQAIAASEKAHYAHKRFCQLLNIPFVNIDCDQEMRMDMNALKEALKSNNIGTVVTTMGTTIVGSIDPLGKILELKERHGFRIHADAAYGGYFALATEALDKHAKESFEHLNRVDSIVLDPHKHGLQPYGCGCVIFKDPTVAAIYKHDSGVTYFSSQELHLGEIGLECSRPGAAAAALWATQQLFPLRPDGIFAKDLAKGHQAALILFERLRNDPRFLIWIKPELDILLWTVEADSASECSRLAEAIFQKAASMDLHLALAKVPATTVARAANEVNKKFTIDADQVTCLRSCLMKPEHLDWLENIWQVLDQATAQVLQLHY
jgi:tyrosine decarboxylase/aspartate 1-decarboxylase